MVKKLSIQENWLKYVYMLDFLVPFGLLIQNVAFGRTTLPNKCWEQSWGREREEKKGVVSGCSCRPAVTGPFVSLAQREVKAMCVQSRAGQMPQPQNNRMQ